MEIQESRETVEARDALASVLLELVNNRPSSTEMIALQIDVLIECKLVDFMDALSDRLEHKTGIRP